MKTYYSVWKLRFIHGLQYRAAAFAGIATQFFFGFVFIMVYEAFYSQSVVQPPMPLDDLVAYIWLQQAFLYFTMLWHRDHELFQLIASGNVAYELCRPCALYDFWYAKLLGQRLAGGLLRFFPILVAASFFPEPYRMKLPPSPQAFLLFLLALFLGLVLVVAISMLVYISVFWTLSPSGSMLVFMTVGEFFSGKVIPVPLMPEWMQTATYMLPFRWTSDFPLRVYSGHIPADEALWGIAAQMVWLASVVILGRRLMRRALRQVVVQGG
jgi:ABC-2 type transport system permease protein